MLLWCCYDSFQTLIKKIKNRIKFDNEIKAYKLKKQTDIFSFVKDIEAWTAPLKLFTVQHDIIFQCNTQWHNLHDTHTQCHEQKHKKCNVKKPNILKLK